MAASSAAERRIGAEWNILNELIRLNPERLTGPVMTDRRFGVTLSGTPAPSLGAMRTGTLKEVSTTREHRVRIHFPLYFPSMPMELYLEQPVGHPNVHPETGFVCLWARHRISNTIEHALHKTVAMLGWRLRNEEAIHVMQPEALALAKRIGTEMAEMLGVVPLRGIVRELGGMTDPFERTGEGSAGRRRRLS